jgi:hypothetical protein
MTSNPFILITLRYIAQILKSILPNENFFANLLVLSVLLRQINSPKFM